MTAGFLAAAKEAERELKRLSRGRRPGWRLVRWILAALILLVAAIALFTLLRS